MTANEVIKKEFYSLVPDPQRRKGGKLLRKAGKERKERFFTNEEIDMFLIKETERLYYWNFGNPLQDDLEKERENLNKQMAEIMSTYLILRGDSSNLSYMALFGQQTQEFMERYELSPLEFAKEFQSMHKSMFGVLPSPDGTLRFVGGEKG